ncbi:transposase [Caldimonas sp. KR1-144]|uniref:transposase n=1 Tax=Caldimonas sp. KR1-144 TaxID=3400911 RepID=UPI003C04250D
MQFSLQSGLVLRCGHRTLEIVRELENDQFQLEDRLTRRPSIISRSNLLNRIWKGEYVLVTQGDADETKPKGKRAPLAFARVHLGSLPESQRALFERRLRYVKAVEKAHVRRGQRERIKAVVQKVAKASNDPRPPSASAVMTWLRRHQQSGHAQAALLSGNHRRRSPRRKCPLLDKLISRVLREVYLTRARHTLRHALDRVRQEAERAVELGELEAKDSKVSYSTLQRRLREVDLFQRIAAREGPARARMVCRTTFGGAGASYPLERVEVDHTVLNWVVICDTTGLPLGRPWLTVMIDAYSGYLLGFYVSFYGPGLTSVSGVIQNAVKPKDEFCAGVQLEHPWLAHGLMDDLIMDNGLEFHARTFQLMGWDLGVDMTYCKVRTPWLKPHVERFFATLNHLTLVRGRVHKRVANVMNIDPAKDAAISFSNLVKGLTMFAADVHPFQINERKLARPYDLYVEGLERAPAVTYPGSWEQLRLTSALSASLSVGPGGVQLRGLPYGGGELLAMHKRIGSSFRTLVKWDPDDMAQAYVQDPRDKTWVTSPCRWTDYADGLSWNQHLLISKFAREDLDAKDAEGTLRRARLRLYDHWLGSTTFKNGRDAMTAARFSGVTSARVQSRPVAVDLAAPAAPIADVEIASDSSEIPSFESFEMS